MSEAETIQHVYHMVPDPMFGKILYPMNSLRNFYLEAYDRAVQKYKWRTSLLEIIVPRLGCRWNDVLHFSIIHPNDIYKALREAGYELEKLLMFFEVPFEQLAALRHAVYHNPTSDTHRRVILKGKSGA